METPQPTVGIRTEQLHHGWSPGLFNALAACLLGGICGYFVLNSFVPIFPFAELPEMGAFPSEELITQYKQAQYAFRSNNGAIDGAILGLCFGAFLGLLTVRTRRILSVVAGGIGGLIGGAVAGYCVGNFAAHGLINKTDQTILQSTLFHFLIWASIAVALSLGISMAQSSPTKQTIAGLTAALVAGAIASISYNAIASTLFPLANLTFISPATAMERMLWIATGSIALAIGFGMGLRVSKSAPVVVAA